MIFPMTEEYRAYLAHKKESPPAWADDILAHYGIKGQKWGVRNYQYAEGGYTPAGAERYWGGTGQGRRPAANSYASAQQRRLRMGTMSGPRSTGTPSRAKSGSRPSGPQPNARAAISPEEQARRRARTRKIIGVAAGVTLAAALGYATYKGSTKLRDNMREDIRRNMDSDFSNLHTMNSKYWDASDRKKYTELTKQHADFMANDVTRRDAAAAKLYEKTGVRLNLPQSRKRVMASRQEQNRYANFIRDAESRGSLNRQISQARKELKSTQEKARRYEAQRNHIQEERYGEMYRQQWEKTIEGRKQMLDDLLAKRRSGNWQRTGVRHIA